MEKGEKIVLAVIIIALLGAAFYFTFLKVGFNVLKAKDSISSKEGLVLELEFDNIANYVYDSFKEIHKNLKENLSNGILLSGGIELWKQ